MRAFLRKDALILRAHGCAKAGFVHGCTYAAKHMDVRERRLRMGVLILRAHGCAKAGFVHGRAYTRSGHKSREAHGCAKAGFVHGCVYIGSAACVEKSMQWQHNRSHMV